MTLIKLNRKIFNKDFKIKSFEVYNKLSLSFLSDLANEIKRDKNAVKYPDLIYLMYWCSKQIKLIKSEEKKFLAMGRGLAFHVCPSNVPTNFIYSFLFGLLSGNSNIVKIPNKNFTEKNIALSILKNLLNKKIYRIFKETNQFIEYSSKVNNFKIVGQEAEIERYGFNVFKRHLFEKNNKNFNAIVISSDAILDEESRLSIKKSHIRVFSVMQGVFLDTI